VRDEEREREMGAGKRTRGVYSCSRSESSESEDERKGGEDDKGWLVVEGLGGWLGRVRRDWEEEEGVRERE